MKLSAYAKANGVTYQTAYRWFRQGLVPNTTQLANGTILVAEEKPAAPQTRLVIYGRVSNASRRKEIDYQIQRIETFCSANGWQIDAIYKEVASGMNDSRKQLWRMIESKPTKIVVENKDRLTRFGFAYLEILLSKLGCEVVVMNKATTDEQDLIRDLVSIITSFCCRLYGLRRGYNKAKKIREEMTND